MKNFDVEQYEHGIEAASDLTPYQRMVLVGQMQALAAFHPQFSYQAGLVAGLVAQLSRKQTDE